MSQTVWRDWRAKLKPRGVLIMHISNRHMELASEVAGIAAANNMLTVTEDIDEDDIGADSDEYTFDSTLAVAANSKAELEPFLKNKGWEEIEPTKGQRVWTDDYSNILGSIIRKWRDGDDEEEE